MNKWPYANPTGLGVLLLGLLAGVAGFGGEARGQAMTDPAAEEVVVDLPDGRPEQFRAELAYQGSPITLALTKTSRRGPHFEVVLQRPDGSYESMSPPPGATYQGYVVERPEVRVSAVLADGLAATLHEIAGPDVEIQPVTTGHTHRVRRVSLPDGPAPRCLEDHMEFSANSGEEAEPLQETGRSAGVQRSAPGCNVVQAELGIDASSEYYFALGGDAGAVLAAIEASVNAINTIYVRDAMIEYLLGRVVIRTSELSDPYYGYDNTYPTGVSDLIARVRNEWNVNQASSQHDVAQLVTTRLGGGAAQNSSICLSERYGVSDAWGNVDPGRFDQIMRHELGHQWSAAHFEGDSPEGPTVMSGNAISRFSAPELDKIEAFRDTRQCLTDLGPSLASIAPYGRLDTRARRSDVSSLLIDVLANDHDANCDVLSIAGVDSTTSLGGTAELSPGTGPGGRDQVLYTPNPLAGSEPDS